MKKYVNRTQFSIIISFIAISHQSLAQLKYVDIGNFQAAFSGSFFESYEHTTQTNDYGSANWLYWPAEYTRENINDAQGFLGAFGLYLAVADFTDKDGNPDKYYYASVWGDAGPYEERIKNLSNYDRKTPGETSLRKWESTVVKADNKVWNPGAIHNDNVDGNIISEMIVEDVCDTEIGITITRRTYAWSQQDHDDYIIMEFILENTGKFLKLDGFRWKRYQPTGWPRQLKDVYFALCYRFQPNALGCRLNGNWGDRFIEGMGHDARHDYVGETYGQPGQVQDDSIRALISWDGDADASVIGYDDTGNPHIATGVLLSPQYVGVGILHADKSPKDPNDDPTQPITTDWRGEYQGKYAFDQSLSGFHTLPDSVVYHYISSGRRDQLRPNQDGLDNLPEEHGYFLGFGPYNFDPNESLRIVTVYAAGGISRHQAIDVGKKWKSGEITDAMKNAILATGRDSLMTTFKKAKLMYEKTNRLAVAAEEFMAPPPPVSFTVTSEIDNIKLKWDGSRSRSVSDFAGFRIYKNYRPRIPIHHPDRPADTLYVKIWECGSGTANSVVVDSLLDTDVRPLWDYRYYLTAFDTEGNESGRYYTLFPEDVYVTPGWKPIAEKKELDNVMVIPNPCINKARQWGRTIKFVNLPAECTISIYTQSGNLVQRIIHPRLGTISDGDEYWEQDTINNQYITSGVYTYTIESQFGNTMGTLVIIR